MSKLSPEHRYEMEKMGVHTRCPGCGADMDRFVKTEWKTLHTTAGEIHYTCGGVETVSPIIPAIEALGSSIGFWHIRPGQEVLPLSFKCRHVDGVQTYDYS